MIVHGRVFDMKHHLIAMNADKDELIKNFDEFKNIKNYPGTPPHSTRSISAPREASLSVKFS
jgi:hypothetical protein